MNDQNSKRLFYGSCFALITTAFSFSIRAGILPQLGETFNPMIATAYSGKLMNTLLNRFHMWFPGGIFLGALVSFAMTEMNLGWEAQIWIIMIPTLIYAYLFYGKAFPEPTGEVGSLTSNLKAMITPLFIFICAC